MDIVRTFFEVQFSEGLRPWLELRGLLRVAGENPSAEIQGQPIFVDRAQRKERVVLQVRALGLFQEAVHSVDASLTNPLNLLQQAHSASPFPGISQLRYDVLAIEPYSLPFHELVALMKRAFLRPTPITEVADDLGLSFDQHDGNVVKHIQIGPMAPDQLRSAYLVFQREELPPQFLFVSLGYEQNEQVDYDEGRVLGFLQAAAAWQSAQLPAILSAIQQSGGE